MFSCWRKTAAAVGALWFPWAMAQPGRAEAATVNRPLSCYHAAAGASAWYNCEREYWYERYYRNSWNDAPTDSITRPSTDQEAIDADGWDRITMERCGDPDCPSNRPGFTIDDRSANNSQSAQTDTGGC